MKELQSEIKQYLVERGWDKIRPADLAKSVSIEAGELLESFQWGDISVSNLKKDAEKFENVKKELADVLLYCLEMVFVLGVDGEKIIREKLDYNKKKFPAKLIKDNRENYYKIKKEYRKKGL